MRQLWVFCACLVAMLSQEVAWATTTFMESGSDATQGLEFYATTSGTVASATDQAKTGPRAVKCSTTASNLAALARTPQGTLTDTGSQISFYFRIDTLPAAGITIFNIQTTTAGQNVWTLQLRSTGILRSQAVGATSADGTTVISVNTWYRISISYYVTNTTTYTFKVYVDGVLDSTANAGTMTRTGTNNCQVSLSASGANINAWYDNIYAATGGASSSSQPDTGNILVTAKRPNANGTTNGFTTQIGVGGSGYGTGHSPQVNEQPLSTTNGWSMIGAGSAITEEYNVENLATGDVNLNGQTIIDTAGWVYSSSLASETGQIILNNATSNIALTSTNTLFTKFAGSATYPAGTGTDIGEITDTSLTTVSLYEAGVLVAYIPYDGTYFLVMP